MSIDSRNRHKAVYEEWSPRTDDGRPKGENTMRISTWRIKELTGYEPITTFYEDFSIADRFGHSAVKDTYRRGLKSAKSLGHESLTEFVMVLNWKIREHYGRNDALARLYNDLWEMADNYARENLKGEELSYYYHTTD